MYHSDKAIIISRRNFREDDLLVSCYTQKYGKIILQAKGARKIKSKLNGHVDIFNLVDLNWVAGKGGNKLIGASIEKSFRGIKENYKKVNYGLYFVNLIDKLTQQHQRDKKIFDFLNKVLLKLEQCEEKDLVLVKLSFDYKLLFLLGYNPTHRRELKRDEKNTIEGIVNLSIEEIKKSNLNRQVLNNLYKKSKMFLEEVLEKEVFKI